MEGFVEVFYATRFIVFSLCASFSECFRVLGFYVCWKNVLLHYFTSFNSFNRFLGVWAEGEGAGFYVEASP